MCGRFVFTKGMEILLQYFPDLVCDDYPKPDYNITPTQNVLTITDAEPGKAQRFHWGLIPPWAKDKKFSSKMINARCETLADKPSFRKPYQTKRCLILADGYYEWQKKTKIPNFIRLKSNDLIAFAGLWETWNPPKQSPVHSCTIITTAANKLLEPIHHRMPVILNPNDYTRWLNRSLRSSDELDSLLVPYDNAEMTYYPVSAYVNNARNNGPQCIQAVE